MHLLLDALLSLRRQHRILQPFAELFQLRRLVVLGDAEFFLDLLQLLAQEEFALVLADLLLHGILDFGLDLGDLQFLFQQEQHLLHAL